MDKIILSGMQFYGYHGVFPEENRLGQRFGVDLELLLDLAKAGATDELEYTVNYAELHGLVKTIAEGKPFKLIEALASDIATKVLGAYTMINEVTVRVTKPHPPFDVHFDGVTIELRRSRGKDGSIIPA